MKTGKHKIASIVLLMIFFSQQISWACGYNLSLLVNPPPSSLIYQDHGEFNRWVAKRVYSMLKPSFMYKAQELKSAYQWLKQPETETVPCSAYVLYNLLQAKGIKPKIEDISASLISLDLKAGNLKPPFTASRIDNSLYAMAKTAEAQGLKLVPVKLSAIDYRPSGHGLASYSQSHRLLTNLTPFIAHLSSLEQGHFVLVTKVDPEKVYFFYDKGDTFLPLEKFLEEFSGYCLLSSASVGDSLPAGRQEHCSVPTIADSESKTVLGAGRSYSGRSVNISGLFKKPSTIESVIGIGTAIGGAFTMGSSGWGSLAASGIKIGGSMLFKDSQWGQIGTSIVAGAVGGGINGGMAGGWKEGLQGAGVGAAKSATISGTMYGISQVKIGNLSPSVMASIGQLVAVPLGNAVGRGLQMGFDLPLYDGSGNRMGTASDLKLKGGFGTGFWQGLTFQTPENGKTGFRDKWGGALQHYGSETASIAVEVFAPSKYSSAYGMGINSAFSVFTNTNDSWGKAVGIAIGKGVAMGGASLLLANLTKDMRVTEGAFLEKAASSLAGAGVESIFGYDKLKSSETVSTSRWGIFSKSLADNWVNTSKNIVTFGNPSGNFLNYQGGYAIAKMHTFGSDIAALRKGGLKSFDAVRYAWNQYVGSSLHYSAINDFSSIAENRLRGVTYANVGKEMHKFELFTDTKSPLAGGGYEKYYKDIETGRQYKTPKQDDSLAGNIAKIPQSTTLEKSATPDLQSQKTGENAASSLFSEIEKGLKTDPDSLELQAAKFALTNGADEHAHNALMKYQVGEIDRKIEYQGKEGTFGNGPLSPQDILYINTYGESVWRDQMNQQKTGLSQNVAKLSPAVTENQVKEASQEKTNVASKSSFPQNSWEIIQDKDGKSTFRMKDGFIGELNAEGKPDIKSEYNPKTGRYDINTPDGKYSVNRVEDKVGPIGLARTMEDGHTEFPTVKDAPNYIPSEKENELSSKLAAEPGIVNVLQAPKEWNLKTYAALPAGKYYDPQANEGKGAVLDLPGYDKEIKGRMIYSGDPESKTQPIMSKQREDGVVELGFVGDVSDVFKQKGITVEDGRITIKDYLSPTGLAETADKIKWNENRAGLGARAAESLPDGRTTFIETVVKDGEIGKAWENKATTVLDTSIYAKGTVFYSKAEGDKLRVSKNKDYSNSVEVDRRIGSSFGDVRAEKGKEILAYKSAQGDLIELVADQPKVSRANAYARTDVIEGVDGLDMESLKYIQDNVGVRLQEGKVYFRDNSADILGVEAPQELYDKWDNFENDPTPLYIVDENNKLQPSVSVKFNDGTTKTYPVQDFKDLIPKSSQQDPQASPPPSTTPQPNPLPNPVNTPHYRFTDTSLANRIATGDKVSEKEIIEFENQQKNDFLMKQAGNGMSAVNKTETNNIANDYLSELAVSSQVPQNPAPVTIIVRKGGAGELTDHGFKVETPTEKMVSGIGKDAYKGEMKGPIPLNALIQPKLGTDNIISRPGKTNGYFYYGIHNDEIDK